MYFPDNSIFFLTLSAMAVDYLGKFYLQCLQCVGAKVDHIYWILFFLKITRCDLEARQPNVSPHVNNLLPVIKYSRDLAKRHLMMAKVSI